MDDPDWKGPYPQIDYGQRSGAWCPDSRAPVYQAMERARLDPAFARLFAADILFGREESGGHCWGYAGTWYIVVGYPDLDLGLDYTQEDETRWDDGSGIGTPGWRFYSPGWPWGEDGPSYVWRPKGGRFEQKGMQRFKCKWLYNENTLNAAKSWVAQLFGPPAVRSGSSWLTAGAWCTGGDASPDWGFIAESPVTGGAAPAGDTARMLSEGHYAFSAKGCNGLTVYVPYAADAKPLKDGRGRWECGDGKRTARGRYYEIP